MADLGGQGTFRWGICWLFGARQNPKSSGSRNVEGFRDAKGLRHLVRRWCPSLHTFLFSIGELTITLEDVVNNLLLPAFGDENPFDISLSDEDLKVEDKLFSHFEGRTTSSGAKPTRIGKWILNLSREKDKAVRQARFLALWLGKFLFSEFPRYEVAIKLAQGAQYPLAPMFLGHVYSQLDLLHGDEVEGNSCYTIISSLHCAISTGIHVGSFFYYFSKM